MVNLIPQWIYLYTYSRIIYYIYINIRLNIIIIRVHIQSTRYYSIITVRDDNRCITVDSSSHNVHYSLYKMYSCCCHEHLRNQLTEGRYFNVLCFGVYSVSHLIRSFARSISSQKTFSPKPLLFFNQFLLLLIITLFGIS